MCIAEAGDRTIPESVAEYCHRSVRQLPSSPRDTRLEQRGEMRLAPDRPWMPFTAVQSIAAERTAFHWRARIRMGPLVFAVVEDAYENGRGRLDARLWGALPVARARGAQIDHSEAQRYLAELVWCPSALLHNDELRFRTVDDHTVRVWAGDERTYVDLSFDGAGDVVGTRTDTRVRGAGTADAVVQPWVGCFSDFRDYDGLRAPSRGEVRWETPEGPFECWRGEVTALRWVRPGENL